MSRRKCIYLLHFVFVDINNEVFIHAHPFQICPSIRNSSLFFDTLSCGSHKWMTPNERNRSKNRANLNNQKYPVITF